MPSLPITSFVYRTNDSPSRLPNFALNLSNETCRWLRPLFTSSGISEKDFPVDPVEFVVRKAPVIIGVREQQPRVRRKELLRGVFQGQLWNRRVWENRSCGKEMDSGKREHRETK